MNSVTKHWQDIYQKKNSEHVSWFEPVPESSLEVIKSCELKVDDAIIDVGGGASLLTRCLFEAGYENLTLMDISEEAISLTVNELESRVNYLCADITSHEFTNKYKLWHDRAVLHFLSEDEDKQHYVNQLKKVLLPGGYAIIATFAVDGPTKCSGLDTTQYDVKMMNALLGSDFKLIEDFQRLHKTPVGSDQLFHYFLYQKE